jgi:signal transduction histidine kinase
MKKKTSIMPVDYKESDYGFSPSLLARHGTTVMNYTRENNNDTDETISIDNNSKSLQILYIEGNKVDQGFFKRMLSQTDLHVCLDVEESIQSGLQALRQNSYDLVFIDFILSDGNGITFLRAIHKIDIDLPVVVLSEHSEEFLAEKLILEGAIKFYHKSDLSKVMLENLIPKALVYYAAQSKRRIETDSFAAVGKDLNLIVSSFPVFFFTTDGDGIIQLAIGKIPGSIFLENDLVGKSIFEAFSGEEIFLRIVGKAQQGKKIRQSIRSGAIILDVNCVPVFKGKKLERICGAITDTTENEEILQASMQAKEVTEKPALMKERFLANMNHEIRTPVKAIMECVDLLLQAKLPKEMNSHIDNLYRSSDTLLRTTNNILDLFKVDSGKLILERTSFLVQDVIDNVRTCLTPLAKQKQLTISIDSDEKLPLLIGDPLRLNQILLNLAINVIKFTKGGGVKISSSLKERAEDHLKIEFQIQDIGIGTPKDNLDGIFESFTQANDHAMYKFGGTGLSLAIVKKLVELHGASIIAESGKRGGSTFRFAFDYKINRDSSDALTLQYDDGEAILKGKKVLIVEKNLIDLYIAKTYLSRWKMEVTTVESGQQAVEAYQKKEYELILMDVQMLGMSGVDAAKKIKSKTTKKDVPIIVITSRTVEEEKKRFLEVGISHYLSKPYRSQDLKRAMVTLLDNDFYSATNCQEESVNNLNHDAIQLTAHKDTRLAADLINIYFTMAPPFVQEMYECYDKFDVAGLRALVYKFWNSVKALDILPFPQVFECFLGDITKVHTKQDLKDLTSQIENYVLKSQIELKHYLDKLES